MKTLENNLNTKKEEQKKIDEELETSKKTLSEATEKVNSSEAMKSKPSLKKPNIPNSISQNSGDPDPKGGKGEKGENGDPTPDTGEKIKVSVQTKTGERGGKYFRTKRKGADRWSGWQSGHYGKK